MRIASDSLTSMFPNEEGQPPITQPEELEVMRRGRKRNLTTAAGQERCSSQPPVKNPKGSHSNTKEKKTDSHKLDQILMLMNFFKDSMFDIKKRIKVIEEDITGMKEDLQVKSLAVASELQIEELKDSVDKVAEKLQNMEKEAPVPQPTVASLKVWKFGFWKNLKHGETAAIYKEWLARDTPFIPDKYKTTRNPNESDTVFKLRESDYLNSLNTQIKIWEAWANEGQAIFESIDSEINRTIEGSGLNTDQQGLLKQEYILAVSKEEEVSHKKWKDIKKGIEDTPHRSETRQPADTTVAFTPSTSAPPVVSYQAYEPRWNLATKHNRKSHKQYTSAGPYQQPVSLSQMDRSVPPPPVHQNQQTGGNGQYNQGSFHGKKRHSRWKKNPQ